MRMYDIISKKKRGEALSEEEIRFFVRGFTDGTIPDYQASALAMAICLRGMTDEETAILTEAIAASGDMLDLSSLGDFSVDKHSTGGVGDKTTLIVAPVVAAAGCKIAKLSGRGLGHTGGTVDKLESFPGFRTSMPTEELISQVKKIGIAVAGQTADLAPADKKLYALRDVTATVDSVPLIASSVMGKKLAAGAKTIVLDVKFGSGSFMKTPEEAENLARVMVNLGTHANRRMAAIISDMDQPLGYAVGNILEIREAIRVLRGEGPADLITVCRTLASEILSLSLGLSADDAMATVDEMLSSGKAYETFLSWIGEQGGDVSLAEHPENFPEAKYSKEILSPADGYVTHMDTEAIGAVAVTLGAGRAAKTDTIDLTAGILLKKKTGDAVHRGEVIATLYTEKEASLAEAERRYLSALRFGSTEVPARSIVRTVIRAASSPSVK